MIYRAVSKVTVRAGDRVKLNDEQAFNARHLVELPAADGFRNVLLPFDLKPGAVFEFDGELPRNLAEPVVAHAPQQQGAAPPAPAVKRTRKA